MTASAPSTRRRTRAALAEGNAVAAPPSGPPRKRGTADPEPEMQKEGVVQRVLSLGDEDLAGV